MWCDYVGQTLHVTLPSLTPQNWGCRLDFTLGFTVIWLLFFVMKPEDTFLSPKGGVVSICVWNIYSTGNDFTSLLTLPNMYPLALTLRARWKTNTLHPTLPNNSSAVVQNPAIFTGIFLFWKHGNWMEWISYLSSDQYKGSLIPNFILQLLFNRNHYFYIRSYIYLILRLWG